MTAYVVFTALRDEQIHLGDEVTVSEKAWRTPGSRMFIEVGKRVSVEDLLLGMIVQSGNDASVALAEYVAGTESVFATPRTSSTRQVCRTTITIRRPVISPRWRAQSLRSFPSTIAGTRLGNSNTTTSSNPTATTCCGVIHRSTA